MKVAPNVPLSVKVADALREIIERDYAQGGQIPNEIELAAEIGVSRGTVRQALSILDDEGIIVRRQGSGTYANPHVLQIKVRADLAFHIEDLIQRAGYEAAIAHVEHHQENAADAIAETLRVPPGTPVLAVRKVFLADGKPAVYLIDYIPMSLIREPYEEAELAKPIFGFLEHHCRLQLKYILSEYIPTNADGVLVDLLGVKPQTALLRCDETHFSRDNEPVMFSHIFYKDELIRFTVLRKYRYPNPEYDARE